MNNYYLIKPKIDDESLVKPLEIWNQDGVSETQMAVMERPLTIFLNNQEIVTTMTIGDYIEYLALGFLKNQSMLSPNDKITAIDYDADLSVVVVRTEKPTNFQEKMRKKIRTSGCAMGTIFGDIMDNFDKIKLPDCQISKTDLLDLLHKIGLTPSIYYQAGAIHGCALGVNNQPIIYMEDVGRHNAVDKIAGYMMHHHIDGGDKIFYTTGRLTSEMVIKTALMGVPILVSRSGFTIYGVELAQKIGLTMIARAKGNRFMVVSHPNRIKFHD